MKSRINYEQLFKNIYNLKNKIGKKDFYVPNIFEKIKKKWVITKKWRFFYRSMRKKDVIA